MASPKSQVRTTQAPARLRRKRMADEDSDSSDDDIPLASSPAKPAATPAPKASKATSRKSKQTNGKVKVESDDESSAVTSKRKRVANGKTKAPPKKKIKREEEPTLVESSTNSAPPKKKVKREEDPTPVESSTNSPKPSTSKSGKAKDEAEEEDDKYRWWEAQQENDGEDKWQTLEHNGVIFPPPYEPLPSHVKMLYKGVHPCQSFCSRLTLYFRQASGSSLGI